MAEILGCHDNFTQRWQTKTRLHKIDDRRSRTHVGRHQVSEGEREVEREGERDVAREGEKEAEKEAEREVEREEERWRGRWRRLVEREVEMVGGKRNKGWEENGGIRDNEVESS